MIVPIMSKLHGPDSTNSFSEPVCNFSGKFKGRKAISERSKYRSPLRYPGGKQRAVERIAELFPAAANEYREALAGGASVYFYARSVNFAQKYWINDKFKELVSFWLTVQDKAKCKKLIEELEALRQSFNSADEIKEFFYQARKENAGSDYREALLFFFFNRVTFSGTTRAGGFSSAASQRRFTASSIERLRPMPELLAGTKITNLNFKEVVNAPGKDVFLFLDPPYYTATKLYGRDGSLHSFDHESLCQLLKKSPHKFLITYDDCDEIRSLYQWANVESWSLQYGMNNCNLKRESKMGAELFISNYR